MTVIKQKAVSSSRHAKNVRKYINGKDALARGGWNLPYNKYWYAKMARTRKSFAMTHSVLNYVEDRNLKLGEEIAVGGFVDSDFANRFMHRIPVVYEPMKEMGKLAGEMIVEKIEDKNRKIPVKTLTCEYDSNDFYKK